MDLLRRAPLTRDYNLRWNRAVAFPDIVVGGTFWGVDVLPDEVIGAEHLGDIEAAIERAYGGAHKGDDIKTRVMRHLLETLKPADEVEQLGLMSEMIGNEVVIRRLTEEQVRFLAIADAMPHAVFRGCAGSGKTMLALEKARRLALQGDEVLLTCFNRALAGWLRRNVAQWPDAVAARVTVQHYHDLAVTTCEAVGSPVDVARRKDEEGFWEATLPEMFFVAASEWGRRFDAIVVDEGQDFDSDWWAALQSLLRDEASGVFYIFLDEQQDLYGRVGELPYPVIPFTLRENLRNSRQITSLTNAYYTDDEKPVARGPEGREPEVIEVPSGRLAQVLGSTLDRLVVREGIPLQRIIVLTPRSAASSELREGLRIGNFAVSWQESPVDGTIRVSTINGFKGLESDVVILAESDHIASRPRWRALWYVALSRARHHVIVLGTLAGPE